MVFGQPVYNTQQRRVALQQFKDYIDELRKKKNLPPWDVAIKTETETEKVRKVRRRRKRRIKRNNLPIKLRKSRRRMRITRRRRIK